MSASYLSTPAGGATMSGMPPAHAQNQPSHAAERPPQSHDRAAAWIVLVGAGATTMSFNIWHALHTGMPLGLALLYGTAPVSLAMGLSHIVAAHKGGWFMKAVTFAAMLAAMAMSVSATGDVVRAAAGPLWWLFGCTVDASALVALQVILSPASRAAARAAKKAASEATEGATTEAVSVPSEVPSPEPQTRPSEEPSSVPRERLSQEPRQRPARISKDPEAERARRVYRQSAVAGTALTDRALAEKFGKSRSWAATRIREAEAGPKLTAQAR